MKITNCVCCQVEIEYKTSKPKYCPDCRKKANVDIVMKSRKKKNPNIEVGVGSGNYSTNNHAYKTGISSYRKLITKEICQRCGSTRYLIIHHKDENRHNNQLDNLEVLCKSCHQRHHLQRDEVTGRYLGKVKRGERVSAVFSKES